MFQCEQQTNRRTDNQNKERTLAYLRAAGAEICSVGNGPLGKVEVGVHNVHLMAVPGALYEATVQRTSLEQFFEICELDHSIGDGAEGRVVFP